MSDRRRDTVIIFALWLMVVAGSSQAMIVPPILPRIGEELAVPEALRGTLVSGFSITMSLCALLMGPISDHIGRRAILIRGTGAMTVALMLHPLAYDYPTFLGIRIMTGMAAGILTGSAVAYVGDYFPYERRGWATGWVMSGIAAAQLAGVPAGTMLAGHWGFIAPFVLFAGVMAVSFTLMVVVVPQPAIERSTEQLTIRSGLRSYAELLRNPQIVGACVAYATMFFATWCFLVYFPTWAETTLSMGSGEIATLFAVGGVAAVIVEPQAGALSDRVGRRPLIIGSCIAIAVLFSLSTAVVRGPWTAYVLFAFSTALFSLRRSPMQALLTALVSDRRRGSLMSLVIAIGHLGGGIGAAVSGLLYSEVGFVGCTLAAAGMILVTAVVVTLRIPEPSAS